MSNNQTPLEKQTVQIDLSKGIDEAMAEETGSLQPVLTRVENLVQERAGVWTKRSGIRRFIDTGKATSRTIATRGGLGMIDCDGSFSVYQETGQVKKVPLGKVSECSVSVDPVIGRVDTGPTGYVASGDNFHAVIVDGAVNLYDIATQAIVFRQDLKVMIGVSGLFIGSSVLTFVFGRWLHIHVSGLVPGSAATCGVYSVWIDTLATLPDPAVVSPVVSFLQSPAPSGAVSPFILDVGTYASTASYVLVRDPVNATYVLRFGASGGQTQAPTTAPTTDANTIYVSNASGTSSVYYASQTRVGYLDEATLAAGTDVALAAGFPAAPQMLMDKNGFIWYAVQTSVFFSTGLTVEQVEIYRSTAALSLDRNAGQALGKAPGWFLESGLFEVVTEDGVSHVLCHMSSGGVSGTSNIFPPLPQHVVVAVNTTIAYPSTTGNDIGIVYQDGVPAFAPDNFYNTFRAVANVEGLVGQAGSQTCRVFPTSTGVRFGLYLDVKTAERATLTCVALLKFGTRYLNKHGVAQIGALDHIGGGTHSVFSGGASAPESGFLTIPLASTELAAGPGITGSFKYVVIYRYTDESGSVTYSRVSPVVSANPVNQKVVITATPPCVNSKDLFIENSTTYPTRPRVEALIYRTLAGGSQFYYHSNMIILQGLMATATPDATTDSVLAAQALLFRQPGTPGSPVDRYPPPGGDIVIAHKDRLFAVDPTGNKIYYSSFFVDGEAPWFNPVFSLFVHGGTGGITGLASLDGRLVVFKQNAIFIIDGDGPGESGPVGNEFSPPSRIASAFGCLDHRSIQVTEDGVYFRSARGIELLSRSLQVSWIGERVADTLSSYQYTLGSVYDISGRYRVLVCTQPEGGVASRCRELVYDSSVKAWSVFSHDQTAFSTSFFNMNDIFQAFIHGDSPTVGYALGGVSSMAEEYSGWYAPNKTDAYVINLGSPFETYVPSTIETGWISVGVQGRARFTRMLALLKRIATSVPSSHKVTVSVGYNYDDAYTQQFTWEPDTLNLMSLEELSMQLASQEVLAVRFRITDAAPTDDVTYPIGEGQGVKYIGLSVEVAQKTGVPKLAATQRA